jgi:hypothetical protein
MGSSAASQDALWFVIVEIRRFRSKSLNERYRDFATTEQQLQRIVLTCETSAYWSSLRAHITTWPISACL